MKYPRGAAGNDLVLFIIFIIALGVIWVSTGGPDRAISRSGPFLGSPFSEDRAFGIPSVGDRSGTSTDDGSGGTVISELGNRLFDLREGEERSPYAEYVSLSVSTAKQDDPNEEYLTVKTARALTGTLTISDWRLESGDSDLSVTLGTGAQLPASGQVNSGFPIAVGANTTVYVTSGRSPIGTSFRVNTCTGYFEQFQDFVPALPLECPFPIEELQKSKDRFFDYTPSIACNNFISTFEQCKVSTNTNVGGIEGQCQTVAFNDLTYNGCAGLHSGDAGFFKNEWRVFLNQNQELWDNKSDRIRLLDEAGRVIDVISY